MRPLRLLCLICSAAALAASCCAGAPEAFGPVPTEAQLRWQKMEMNMFCHFGPNTFTGLEWGEGTEPEDIFAPSALDCGQWAEIARSAGFGGIILTAKHHDGFCLWPSPESSHSVSSSSWRGGRGDVLAELSQACRSEGIGFGVYISPWDRNDPTYGTPDYNGVFARTVASVHEAYGPVFEQWFDGACGEGPDGKKQQYDWPLFNSTVLSVSPDAVIFSDVGPGCRWVGNENGFAGETCWSTLSPEGFSPGAGAPSTDVLSGGVQGGTAWIPAEADVSIRPGWFWRESETSRLKSVRELLDIYMGSVGRNAVLLLNVPPDMRGRIDPADSLRLMEFRSTLDCIFGGNVAKGAAAKADAARARRYGAKNLLDGDYDSFWAAPEGATEAEIVLALPEERSFNLVQIQEYIPLGQRVSSFELDVLQGGEWTAVGRGTTIGYKRIVRIPEVRASALRLRLTGMLAPAVLSSISLHQDNYREGL